MSGGCQETCNQYKKTDVLTCTDMSCHSPPKIRRGFRLPIQVKTMRLLTSEALKVKYRAT